MEANQEDRSGKPARLLIVDDHRIIWEALRALIRTQPHLEICAEASNGPDAILRAGQLRPDVVVTDIVLPGGDGIEVTRAIRRELPETEVVVLTGHANPEYMRAAFAAGARAFVTKADAHRTLLPAIAAALQHQNYITSDLSDLVVKNFQRPKRHPDSAILTARELEITTLIAQGKATKEIADMIGVSLKTVESHRTNILRKLGMHSAVEITRYAIRQGIIEP